MNLLHANIGVHIRRLIAELPGDGVKCISKIQSHCANIAFAEKLDMTLFYSKLHIKEGNQQLITSRDSKIHRLYQFQWETVLIRIS